MKNRIMSVVVLVAAMTGCAATADSTGGTTIEPDEAASISEASKPKPAAPGDTLTKDAGTGTVSGGGSSPDSGSATADSGSAAAEDSGAAPAPTDLCPPTQPTAGDPCTDSGSGFCGYGSACGLALASCVDGKWEVSGSSSC